jgi:hypothetical protein
MYNNTVFHHVLYLGKYIKRLLVLVDPVSLGWWMNEPTKFGELVCE